VGGVGTDATGGDDEIEPRFSARRESDGIVRRQSASTQSLPVMRAVGMPSMAARTARYLGG
jgi:hypothetical protein